MHISGGRLAFSQNPSISFTSAVRASVVGVERPSVLVRPNGVERFDDFAVSQAREDFVLLVLPVDLDVAEDDKRYTVKAELPEMKREDIKVGLDQGVLSISGERKFEKEEKDKKYHRVERAYGSFLRSFTLPDNADAGQVDAQYRDGVLTVKIGKSEKAKPRAIDVKVG